MSRLVFALTLVVGLAPALAHAQAAPSPVSREAEQRAALRDQGIAATTLYVSTMFLGTYAISAGTLGLIGSVTGPACIAASCAGDRDPYGVLFVSAIVAGPLAAVLLSIAIGLDVDRRSRRDALDRLAGRVRLAPGPGELGIAMAVAFDG